jgi:hypothetical protein
MTAESVRETFAHDVSYQELWQSTVDSGTRNPSESEKNEPLDDVSLGTALPVLLDTSQTCDKEHNNLLSIYLRLLVGVQGLTPSVTRPSIHKLTSVTKSQTEIRATQAINLAGCGIQDNDLNLVLKYARLIQLQSILILDLSNNHISSKCIGALSAFMIAIPGNDLSNREKPLEINLQYNKLSKVAIEKMCLRIQRSSRDEVKLVEWENKTRQDVICLYGTDQLLVRIDCRNNNSNGSYIPKVSLQKKISLGRNVTESLPLFFPGDDASARNPTVYPHTIFPRDSIMKNSAV